MKIILKARLRRLYLKIHRSTDDMSCGAHLASFIRPEIDRDVAEFNSTLAELQKIDPEARHLRPMT